MKVWEAEIILKMIKPIIFLLLFFSFSLHSHAKKYISTTCFALPKDSIKIGKCGKNYFIENKNIRFVFADSNDFKKIGKIFQQNFFGNNRLVKFKIYDCKERFRSVNDSSEKIEEFNDPVCNTLKTVANIIILDFKKESNKNVIDILFVYCDLMWRKYKYQMTYTISILNKKQIFKVVKFEYLAELL